jgi:hypothetical protein
VLKKNTVYAFTFVGPDANGAPTLRTIALARSTAAHL